MEWNRTKEAEFELATSLHRNWLNYAKNHEINKDLKMLSRLLSSSSIVRTEEEVLDALYDSTLIILESTPKLTSEQKTNGLYLSYNLCTCHACQEECGSHINKKGQIRISKKFFRNIQKQGTSSQVAFLELMHILLHQLLHAIFPKLEEDTIIEKTEQVWKSGMNSLAKQKKV